MGSCVSVQRAPESAMGIRFSFGSKNDKVLMTSSQNKAKADTVDDKSPFGSKEESFFDSRPWLDSDSEDDFRSVNADFTPSRGNTPVHHNFSVVNPQANNSSVVKPTLLDSEPTLLVVPAATPDKSRRLSDLFKESLRNDHYGENDENAKSTDVTPHLSRVNSQGSSGNGTEGKSVKSMQCCFPGMASSRSFNERKKMTTSPALTTAVDDRRLR